MSNARRHFHARFSLLELLVAIAIIALALSSTLLMVSQSQRELIRARQQWEDQHAMTQACEYLLLANPKNLELPPELLPMGYEAEFQLRAMGEQLPEFAQPARQGWILVAYDIVLLRGGEFVDRLTIHKILRETDQ